jgi:hypothetical protein
MNAVRHREYLYFTGLRLTEDYQRVNALQ